MIASEMPAAIRPYSIAVAPDWSRKNFIKISFIIVSLGLIVGTRDHSRSGDQLPPKTLKLYEQGCAILIPIAPARRDVTSSVTGGATIGAQRNASTHHSI